MSGKRIFYNGFLLILILVTVNLFIFLPSMNGDFLWDDKYFISQNPQILSPFFLKRFLTSPYGGFSGVDENSILLDRSIKFYRPFTSLSYWIDYKIWGLNPAAFHLTNILLHMMNTIILFLILLSLGLNKITSFFSSLLFSVFPLHFENVSWISGRTDLLSFLFAALSVLFFTYFFRKNKYLYLFFSSIFYLCSLLSKENALFLIIIYFFVLYKSESKLKDAFFLAVPFFLSTFTWFVFRRVALGSLLFEPSGRSVFDFLSAVGFYVFKIFFPFKLSVSVDAYPVFNNIFYTILGGGITSLFFLSAIFLWRKPLKDTKPFFMVCSFYLFLLPSVIVIFFSSTVSYIAWRFMYLPSALFVSCFVYLLFKKMKYKHIIFGLLAVLFFFYSAEIYPHNRHFGKDETSFWQSFNHIDREDLYVRVNVGQKYFFKDEKKALLILNDILAQKSHPQYERWRERIYEELAAHYTFKKDFKTAEKYFDELFKMRKEQSQYCYFIYAYFLAFKGNIQGGEAIVRNMLNLYPKNHRVLIYSAKFYSIIKDYQEALELLERDFHLFRTQETLQLIKGLQRALKK